MQCVDTICTVSLHIILWLTDIPTYMSVYTVLYSIAHLVIIVNKSYFNQINIYITYLLQLYLEVFELTQLTGQTGGQTCDTLIIKIANTDRTWPNDVPNVTEWCRRLMSACLTLVIYILSSLYGNRRRFFVFYSNMYGISPCFKANAQYKGFVIHVSREF